jgi:hypothetical protein
VAKRVLPPAAGAKKSTDSTTGTKSGVTNKNVNVEIVHSSSQSPEKHIVGRKIFFDTEKAEGDIHYKKNHHTPMTPQQLTKHLRNELFGLSVRIQDHKSYSEKDPVESLIFHRALGYNLSKLFVVLWELDHRVNSDPKDLNSAQFKNWRNKFAHLTDVLSVEELKKLATEIKINYINPLLAGEKVTPFTPEKILGSFPKTEEMKKIYYNLHEKSKERDYNPRPFSTILKDFEKSLDEFKRMGKILVEKHPADYHNHPDIRDALKMSLAQIGDCLQELEARQDEDNSTTWNHLMHQDKDGLISKIIVARNKVFHNVQKDVRVDILSQFNQQIKDWKVNTNVSLMERKRASPGKN